MTQFENAETAIAKDVKEVFEEIRQEIHSNYFASGEHDLTYVRQAVDEYLPTTIVNRNLLLVDTLLNYLTKDARKILENADSKVVNTFYEWDHQQAEKLKAEFKSTILPKVSLSSDLRVKYGTIAGIGGAGGTFVIADKLLLLNMGVAVLGAAVVGFLMYKLVYQKSTSAATRQTEDDINQWLQEEQKNTLRRLQDVIEKYKQRGKAQFVAW